MESKTQRNSAIELLRIVSMFFIIMRHYSTQTDWGGWTTADYSFNVLFLQLITIGGSTANNIFLLISGYHMIRSGVRVKNVLRLLAEMFFYSWAIAAVLGGFHIVSLSVKDMIKAAVPIWFGYNWYICCYIIFCCFVPFLNEYLNSISRQTYRRLLAVALFLWSFCYTFMGTNYLGTDFSIDHFAVMYALGGYIRLYGSERGPVKSWWRVFTVLAGSLALSVVIFSVGGYLLDADVLIRNATYFSAATSILDVAVATALFLAVIHAKPFYSKWVNTLAGSAPGIFMLHYSPLITPVIWSIVWPNVNYLHSPYLPLHMLAKVTAIFVVCLAIDLLRRRFLEPPFSRWLERAEESPLLGRLKDLYSTRVR